MVHKCDSNRMWLVHPPPMSTKFGQLPPATSCSATENSKYSIQFGCEFLACAKNCPIFFCLSSNRNLSVLNLLLDEYRQQPAVSQWVMYPKMNLIPVGYEFNRKTSIMTQYDNKRDISAMEYSVEKKTNTRQFPLLQRISTNLIINLVRVSQT